MLVEGLMTYVVVDPLTVVKKIGYKPLLAALTNTAKAELSRIFANLHMEQITSSQYTPPSAAAEQKKDGQAISILGSGGQGPVDDGDGSNGERQSRSAICAHVLAAIGPTVAEWGVKVVTFQLESIKLADAAYAKEYEEASLATAKAKANLRSVATQNEILLSTADTRARADRIEAEGKKSAMIIAATADAESRKIEADARAKAATVMANPFSQQLALAQLQANIQTEVAKSLRIGNLMVSTDSNLGKILAAQSLFNPAVSGMQAVAAPAAGRNDD